MLDKINAYEIKRLRNRYLMALCIIAALVITSQAIIQFTIFNDSSNSRSINIAGRQRMISQKITKTVLEIHYMDDAKAIAVRLGELESMVALWESSHKGLIEGNKGMGLPGHNSLEVLSMYADIEPYFEAILIATKAFIQQQKEAQSILNEHSDLVQVILLNEGNFLKGMDAIVFKLDDESQESTKRLIAIEWTIMVSTLCLLVIELIFIFKPAECHIQSAMANLQESENNVRKLFDVAPSAMFLVKAKDYAILRLNVLACEFIGIPFNKAINRKLYDFISGEYLDVLDKSRSEQFQGEVKQVEVVLRNESGESLIMLMSVTPMTYMGQAIYLVGLSDITDRKNHELALQELATTDEMTDLLNRRTGLLLLSKEIERANREPYDLSVVFIDLDGLKKVNDDYGHSDGDWFIKQVAKVLNNNVRQGDIAFRYGGDEMVLVFSNCTGADAYVIMNRIELDLVQINKRNEKPFLLALSYGISDYGFLKPIGLDGLLADADAKMYEQKQTKRAARQ